MSEVYESIMSGLEEAITLKQATEIFRGILAKHLRELAASQRREKAAVEDLRNLSTKYVDCTYCADDGRKPDEIGMGCWNCKKGLSEWEWRGPQAEEGETHE